MLEFAGKAQGHLKVILRKVNGIEVAVHNQSLNQEKWL